MGRIRTAARALIVREGQLLLTHCRDERGEWYTAPGGGQAEGERLPETLVRECREEIGAEVEVVGLRFVRDYIAAEHAFSYLEEAVHQVELFFECRVPASYRARNGPQPDSHQVGVIWADAEALRSLRVYPSRLREVVDPAASPPVYWGSGE
jgi:ADP-ribose pyrophosphatase YjhB (NUDIX family)